MKPTDDEIIMMISDAQHWEKGFRMLMEAYQSKLYWHIRRLVIDHEVAQDILQDTFVKVHQNFHQFKKESKLYTWIYKIATNEALQQLNKIKKMQKTDADVEVYLTHQVTQNAKYDADEIQIILQKAIQQLPEKQKLVFTMRYYDELPYEEMSKILEMSIGTLKTNYHYAKQKIEEYISQNYDE